jgi:protein-S-isoprenylcysteine O-methyltransferase Ste14/uncharacterized membrane protein (UPF0127 family)
MPLTNTTQHTSYSYEIYQASTFFGRLMGLAGSSDLDPSMVLWLIPCKQIHTYGMTYPIDVLYLNRSGKVIGALSNVQPNTIPQKANNTMSVLELAAGTIQEQGIKEGDQLGVVPDKMYQPHLSVLSHLMHWPVNIVIALLWSRLVNAALQQGIAHPHPMHFGILIHNTLLMCFFLTRRKSVHTSFRFVDWAVPILTLCAAMLLRPTVFILNSVTLVSSILQYIGITGIIIALLSLGRSFGIIPANRKVVRSGVYRFIRHPMYISEILFYTGFVVGNPTLRNMILIILVLAGQIWRAISEEVLLCSDPSYRVYMQSVRYRFIPGVF